jgi:hypothetical protein
MKITFEHIYGLQNNAEVYHYIAYLSDVANNEYDNALDQGWLRTVKHGIANWYQSRSTRCNLAITTYDMFALGTEYAVLDPLPYSAMDHIYTSYCYLKKFKKYFEVNECLIDDIHFGYYDNQNLVAWSKLRKYSCNSIETVMFAWDYANPALRLGESSLRHEIAWAKEHNYRYIYLGPGYQRNSIYKSKIPGFEWWTGKEWSSDIAQYKWLCQRDSHITQCEDLHDLRITK